MSEPSVDPQPHESLQSRLFGPDSTFGIIFGVSFDKLSLCPTCRSLFKLDWKGWPPRWYMLRMLQKINNRAAYSIEKLFENSLKKDSTVCLLCLLFIDLLPTDESGAVIPKSVELWIKGNGDDGYALHMLDEKLVTFRVGSAKDQLPHRESQAELNSSTSSLEALSFVRRCVEICDRDHTTCIRKKHSTHTTKGDFGFRLPTRLIDIGTGSSIQPQLIESTALEQETDYLTLIHCWGDHLHTKLLGSNLNSMKQAIKFETLPRTFQDALIVTKTLGMRYMWIDALCIIQDSGEDWQRESAQMCHIYENTYCNISATASKDIIEGLFRDRDPRLLPPLTVKIGSQRVELVRTDLWNRKVEAAPLNGRAWVLQERVLSPRNLHFSTYIFWECNEMTLDESSPQRPLGTTNLKQLARILRDRTWTLWFDATTDDIWDKMVSYYSDSVLSFETNKLMAIGGLAEKFQSIKGDTYYAGLWGCRLVVGLLWKCSKTRVLKPKQYIAPSWSWASVIGKVTYSLIHRKSKYEDLVNIKGVDIEYTTSNRFGQVKSGTIHLAGKLFRLTSYCSKSKRAMPPSCLVRTQPGSFHHVNNIFMDLAANGENDTQAEYFERFGLPVLSDHETIRGLLLVSCDKAGQFRRVGVFLAYGNFLELVKIGIQCFASEAQDSGLDYGDDGRGGYEFSISIV